VTNALPGECLASGETVNNQGRSPTRRAREGKGGEEAGAVRMAGERRGLECEGWDRISYSKLGAERAGWMYTPGVRGAGGMYGRACAWGIGDGV
jgi:hypothetical protein